MPRAVNSQMSPAGNQPTEQLQNQAARRCRLPTLPPFLTEEPLATEVAMPWNPCAS